MKPDCLVCSRSEKLHKVVETETLTTYIERITTEMQLRKPTFRGAQGYLCGTGVLAQGVAFKMELTFKQLIADGHIANNESFTVIDENIPGNLFVKIQVDPE